MKSTPVITKAKKILISFILLCFVFSFCSITSFATNTKNSPQYENALKIWSVCKAAGFTDEEAAGVLGNMNVESGLDSTKIECFYSEAFTWGPQKKAMASSLCEWTLKHVLPAYAINWNIPVQPYCSVHGAGPAAVEHENPVNTISVAGYQAADGHYYCGIGTVQWTGQNVSRLLEFASSIHREWYELDTQLMYLFNIEDPTNGWAKFLYERYREHEFSSVDDCAEAFARYVEGNVHAVDGRKAFAHKWYNELHGQKGDLRYGRKILKSVGWPVKWNGDIIDQSIVHKFSGAVINFNRSVGFLLDFDNSLDKKSNDAATEILVALREPNREDLIEAKNNNGKYSLYELFGPDLNWYYYFGEATQPIKLLDHVYSAYDQNKLNDLTLSDTVFYDSTRYLSCRVYPNRVSVLTTDDITNGKVDPRVSAMSNDRFSASSYVKGSTFLTVAKYSTALVGFLLGPKPIEEVKNVFDFLTDNEIWSKIIAPIIMIITGFGVVAYIFSIVGKAKKYAVGSGSARETIARVSAGLLSITLIFLFSLRPTVISEVVTKSVTIIDELFNSVILETIKQDEVIGVDDSELAVEAVLWKTTIFEPWCIGQFGEKYDKLYTQYSTVSADKKMPQSYATDDDISWLDEGEYLYNSAKYTGDIIVPVGNNYGIKNWAAFLWSCQSKYHIDQGYIDRMYDIPQEISFPNARTTAYNSQIAADTFRVIDAQMNISPQVYKSQTIASYTDSKALTPKFESQGRIMLIYALVMLVSFMPAILAKLKNLLMLLFTAVQAIYYSIRELVHEGDGLANIPHKLKTFFLGYLLASLRIFVLVTIYALLVGKSFILTVMYLLLVFIIYNTNFNTISRGAARMKQNISFGINALKNRF